MYQDDRYFRTNSFYLAAFLFAKGQIIVNIDWVTDPKRAQFVFSDSPGREELVNQFNFSKENTKPVLVDARKFVVAIKQLKDKMYQGGGSK